MDLDYGAQRRYCEALGIIPADDGDRDTIKAWHDNPDAQQVSRLLGAMDTLWRQAASAAKWIRGQLDDNDQRMEPGGVHTSGLYGTSSGVARHALEYDAAIAAYYALERHLTEVAAGILRRRGYEIGGFWRLEDIPAGTPE